MLRRILPLVEQHEHVLIVHGNGPQVGNELLRSEFSITHTTIQMESEDYRRSAPIHWNLPRTDQVQ